jgi:hypothetical protein
MSRKKKRGETGGYTIHGVIWVLFIFIPASTKEIPLSKGNHGARKTLAHASFAGTPCSAGARNI